MSDPSERIGLAISGTSFAWLSRATRLPTDVPISIAALTNPTVTPQLGFVLDTRLTSAGNAVSDVLAATRSVCGALVVHDDIGGNISIARFALGTRALGPTALDLALIGVLLQDFGDVVETGAGAAVLGHPAEAIARVVDQLAGDDAIEPGMLVLTGALTDPVPLTSGSRIAATFAHLGRVDLPVAP